MGKNHYFAVANTKESRKDEKFRCFLRNRDDDDYMGKSITPECNTLKSPEDSPERYRLTPGKRRAVPQLPPQSLSATLISENRNGHPWLQLASEFLRPLDQHSQHRRRCLHQSNSHYRNMAPGHRSFSTHRLHLQRVARFQNSSYATQRGRMVLTISIQTVQALF